MKSSVDDYPNSSLDQLNSEPSGPAVYSWRVLAATLSVACFLLLLLEFRWPYYFLQDDGLDYFLPAYVHNWRSFHSGHLPLYNFHIFTGTPHLAMGQTGVLYFPQYVAMFLSETIWGHPFAAIDLMAFMHALIAVAGGYVLLRYLGTTEAAASFGALCALSGFLVWAGRVWPAALMLCAWFPWMVWAALRYLERPSVRRGGWLMFLRLGLLYGGQPQFFVLAMIFEHLFVLSPSLVTRRPGWESRCGRYLVLNLPTVLLGLPFLLPVWGAVGRSLERYRPMSYAEFSELRINPLLWVFGQILVTIQLKVPTHFIPASLPYLSYVGYISSLLPFGAGVLWNKRPKSRPWIIASGVCFMLAFLWCTNLLGPLIFNLPLLNRFRWPFKLLFFAGFFQCTFAALVLTIFSRRWQRIAVAGFVANWIVIFSFFPNHAWRVREYRPPLKSPWEASLKGGRYLVVSQDAVEHVSRQLVDFDYSTLWGLDDVIGYDQLAPSLGGRLLLGRAMTEFQIGTGTYNGVVDQPLLDNLKKWGVKFVLLGPRRSEYSGELLNAGFKAEVVKQGWTLWEDPNSLPRVRWGDVNGNKTTGEGIHWAEHVNSIDVSLDQWPGRQLVFAFAANPGLETCLDGHCNPVSESADGLIRVDVPPGTRGVRLVYHEPLLLPSVMVALGTLMLYLFLLLRSRRVFSHHEPSDHESPPPLQAPHAN